MTKHLSLSTDQVAAFVELARQGSLRGAAAALHITEQGVRNRLFLPHALAFLDRARQLGEVFAAPAEPHEIHVVATQYLILYVLIEAVRNFHQAFPRIRVRLSNHTEQEIEAALLHDPEVALGVAAPYESSP